MRTKLTTKVDVYSFGIVLWEIVKKEAAFSHYNDYAKFSRAVTVLKERPPTDGLHPVLVNFLTRCWAPLPQDRPDFPEICKLLDEAMLEIACEDPAGREFWRANFPGQIKATWKDFVTRFYKTLNRPLRPFEEHELPVRPTEQQLQSATPKQRKDYATRNVENFRAMVTFFGNNFYDKEDVFLTCLKMLFAPTKGDDFVHLDHFGAVLGWLGPTEPKLLDRFASMIESDWFHGFMSKLEAEDRLRNEKPGTFLVRFSNNSPNNFVISKLSSDKTFKHMLVRHDPGKGFLFNETKYVTFEELLVDCKKKFNLLRASTNSIFKAMLQPESAYTAN